MSYFPQEASSVWSLWRWLEVRKRGSTFDMKGSLEAPCWRRVRRKNPITASAPILLWGKFKRRILLSLPPPTPPHVSPKVQLQSPENPIFLNYFYSFILLTVLVFILCGLNHRSLLWYTRTFTKTKRWYHLNKTTQILIFNFEDNLLI